jgi:hypothetical protein
MCSISNIRFEVLHKNKLTRPSTSSCSTSNYNSIPNNNKSAASIKQTGILLNL